MKINGITVGGGTNGTSGSSGTSGDNGSSGTSGTSGTNGGPVQLINYGSEISGTTALTKSASFLLPANTLTSSNTIIYIQWRGRKSSGTAATTTIGLYNNTSDSTVGATLLGSNTLASGSANRMGLCERHLLYNGTTGQISRQTPGTLGTDMGLNTLTYTSVSFNRSVDNYFIFTITNASAADAGIIDFGFGTFYI